ncbi:Jip5p Ecym_2604 [Eremothecium cymbalariae DBVPG|uniref:WD repeat-containing protein JIP5 n=1 Tax=Eremothecium cymbalariae (strain CBS 270.75 / DBVPG 7215 / KCTC 17166 / NRRL Y-17582) TaxID=931890 RepID=G8JQI4_ERECY|nr:Hypothetical protein Ecym_2604 [Eremothecium cymbalariae DBVPG\
MGKKKSKQCGDDFINSQKNPLLELKFENPLFAIACHPEKPIIVTGLATGHMFCHEYNVGMLRSFIKQNLEEISSLDAQRKSQKSWQVVNVPQKSEEQALTGVTVLWSTRRHKGSVRSIALEADGSYVYSIGSDNVLKKANTYSGKVVNKAVLSEDPKIKYTKLLKSSTHPFLLLGSEDGNVEVYNSSTLKLMNTIQNVHGGDPINDIFQFVGKSVYKHISLGQTTLARWDCRQSNEIDTSISPDDKDAKGNVLLSDNQEDEMLSGTFVDPTDGETLVCGMGEGVLTVWKPKKNDLVDQLTRIKICRGESIDCVMSSLQDDGCVWCGCSNGKVYKVNVKLGKVVEVRKHSRLDEVSFLDLDYDYRLISGGMDKMKIWESDDFEYDFAKPCEGQKGVEDEGFVPVSVDSAQEDSDGLWEQLEKNHSDLDTNSGKTTDSSDSSSESELDEDSSSGEVQLAGLSKEELIAELDKDLDNSDKPKRALNTEISAKNKKLKNASKDRKAHNAKSHFNGIRRFDGL